MRKTIEFDPAKDAYADVLVQLQNAYGFGAWTPQAVARWISEMTPEQLLMVKLLSAAEGHTVSKDAIITALGSDPQDKKGIGGLTLSINSSAKRVLNRRIGPIEYIASRRLYSMDHEAAVAVLEYLGQD
ncbi:hypothetical protein ACFU99_14510 [Streptomyces sp. NPDC057654]|uniref:hypothetical protein n=1 Tax=Streptomyces sp. NPDC057654 TaxID=3346196 RepID=UPI00367A1214